MEQRTAKEIQAYKIRTLIFLLIILALTVFSIYQFYTVQETNRRLKQNIKELKEAKGTIADQDKVIEQGKVIEKQKVELDEAISLLSILVNEDSETQLDNEYILSHLHELVVKKEEDIQLLNKKRAGLIKNILSTSSERARENARDEIVRNHSSDVKLISQLMDATEGKVNANLRNPIYQILYTLNKISDHSLTENKTKIQSFLDATKPVVGQSTQSDIRSIERKLRAS